MVSAPLEQESGPQSDSLGQVAALVASLALPGALAALRGRLHIDVRPDELMHQLTKIVLRESEAPGRGWWMLAQPMLNDLRSKEPALGVLQMAALKARGPGQRFNLEEARDAGNQFKEFLKSWGIRRIESAPLSESRDRLFRTVLGAEQDPLYPGHRGRYLLPSALAALMTGSGMWQASEPDRGSIDERI